MHIIENTRSPSFSTCAPERNHARTGRWDGTRRRREKACTSNYFLVLFIF
uniref:Uncharacterized protein n=1 Tax=Pseudonaja textilis TaxID=8673 RepID=A0A670XY56_PSETE